MANEKLTKTAVKIFQNVHSYHSLVGFSIYKFATP